MKSKKILASLLSVAMLAVSGSSFVMAEDTSVLDGITINNFEADTECITIYPSAELDVAALADAITLTENGKAVDVTVEAVKTHISDFNKSIIPDYVDNTNYSQAPSYKIKKASGFETEKIYGLTIDDYNKVFKIESVFEDDFSGDTSKWTFAQESGNSTYWGSNTMNVVDGALEVTTGAACSYLHTLLPADWKNMINLEDYTVQFDMSMAENNGGEIQIGLTTSSGLPTIGTNSNGGVYYVKSNGWINVTIPTEAADGPIGTWSTDETVDEVNATYKMAFKDNRNTLYLDGVKFADYTSEYFDGKGVFGISFKTDSVVYTVDNVIMTKLVDLTDVADLTINEFEADTECLTIYPSAEVNADELEAAITLKEGGVEVDVTVEAVKTHDYDNDAFDYTANTNFSQAPSYKIKKTGGFECEKIYEITIGGLMSADDSALLKNGYRKLFKLEELFADDFSGDTSKWTLDAQESGNSTYWGSNTMNVVDGALQITTGAACSYLNPLLPADWKNMVNLEDYTVQFDVKSPTEASDGYFQFGLTTSTGLAVIDGLTSKYAVRRDKLIAVDIAGSSTYAGDAIVDEANATFKMVAKDNRNVLFIDGVKFADWTNDSYDAKGVFGISFNTDNTVYTIDNVIMTKLVDLTDVTELTINEFEADTECITIYPSAEVDVDELAAAITLKEGANEVDVTVEAVKTHDYDNDAFDYTANTNFSQAPSYRIKKANGFNCNTFYSLTIDQIMSADRAALMANVCNKSFKIEALFADDFSNDTSKWTLDAQESGNPTYYGSNTMAIVDGALQITTGAACSYLNPLLPADWKNMVNLEDYTVQFDVKSPTEASDGYFQFGLTTSTGLAVIDGLTSKYAVRRDKLIAVDIAGSSTYAGDAIVDEANATFKMVAKDNRNVLFIDGVKFADWTNNSYDAKGVFGISFKTDNAVYTIDNVIMTKVVDFSDEVMITDVVINNGADETIEGLTTADITVAIQNSYKTDKPCKVIVAVYDSENNDMKNAVSGTITTLTPGSNIIPVEDMAINGADTLKVFVFDGLDTLTPYCEPKGI